MDRHLFVLRHAKANELEPGVEDHDRTLSPRGVSDLAKLRRAVAEAAVPVTQVLCSTSVRTAATLEGIRPALLPEAEVVVDRALYGAGRDELLARIRQVDDGVSALLVIGHNPGVEELIIRVTRDGTAEALDQLATKVPTGTLAELRFTGSWADLDRDTAMLASLRVPRRLPS